MTLQPLPNIKAFRIYIEDHDCVIRIECSNYKNALAYKEAITAAIDYNNFQIRIETAEGNHVIKPK